MIKKVELRPYQIKVVEDALQHKEGILNMTVGSGKSLCGLEIIFRLGLTACVLVPNSVLLRQWQVEAKKFYNYDVGILGDGEKNIKDINVATFQILMADKELLDKVSKMTSVVIIDEVHGIVSKERVKILNHFKPAYLYGLTGSCMRSNDDGRTEAIHFICGDIIANYESEQLKPIVDVIRTGVDIPITEYHEMIDSMVNNDNRNTLIAGLVLGEVMSGRKVLVLTKRIEHWRKIQEKLGNLSGFYYVDSEDSDRNTTLMALKRGELNFRAIFGTSALLSTGLDIVPLDLLMIVSDLKSSVLTIQSAGRIMRMMQGKENARIIDLWDNKNPILTRQFNERCKVYEAKGWPIVGLYKKKRVP